MKRFLSHKVIVNGVQSSGLTVATINDDNTVEVAPFTEEIHSTVYVNGSVVIEATPDNNQLVSITINN